MKRKFALHVLMAALVIISFALSVFLRISYDAPPEVLNIIYFGTLILLYIIPRWFIYWLMLGVSWIVIYFTEIFSAPPIPPAVVATSNILSTGFLLFFVAYFRIKSHRTLIYYKDLSNKDPLTHLYNRRYFEKYICSFFMEERRKGVHSIILIDIDHFKYINDKHGHLAGDIVIKNVAKILDNCIHEKKLIVRFGGDELLLFLPYLGTEQVIATAEVIRKEVEKHSVLVDGKVIKVTVSMGISCFKQFSELIKTMTKADKAMYQAKTQGRNRVVLFEEA